VVLYGRTLSLLHLYLKSVDDGNPQSVEAAAETDCACSDGWKFTHTLSRNRGIYLEVFIFEH